MQTRYTTSSSTHLIKTMVHACRDFCDNLLLSLEQKKAPLPTRKPAVSSRRGRPRNPEKQRRVDEIFYATLDFLRAAGAPMPGYQVFTYLCAMAPLSENEKGKNPAGQLKIATKISFLTSLAVRAGFMTKQRGMWTITESGREALSRHTEQSTVGREIVRLTRANR